MASKLKKFLLRYHPPGLILQYERDGIMKQKPVDLLDLSPDVDIEVGSQQARTSAPRHAVPLTASACLPVLLFPANHLAMPPRRCCARKSSGKSPSSARTGGQRCGN